MIRRPFWIRRAWCSLARSLPANFSLSFSCSLWKIKESDWRRPAGDRWGRKIESRKNKIAPIISYPAVIYIVYVHSAGLCAPSSPRLAPAICNWIRSHAGCIITQKRAAARVSPPSQSALSVMSGENDEIRFAAPARANRYFRLMRCRFHTPPPKQNSEQHPSHQPRS